MQKIAAVVVLAGSLAVAGPASAHDHSGDVVGALIGGALIGAVVGAAVNNAAAPVYQAAPVYAPEAPAPAAYVQAPAPAYAAQPAPAYAAAPAGGYCYDRYSGGYVACAPAEPAPPPPPPYDGYSQPAGW
ncbi:ecotin precursor [Paraburkholderia sp. J12]|uniref:ecotin precursor n=1 Tax=Paraburkholderia sp. J12 TaxID=2805432 RepID=UPI002ABDC3BF|nr:ecotin precursor [Paraburkholderia sp. J12]